jgi:hypothetical protein
VAGLLEEPRHVGPDLSGLGIEALGLAIFRERLVEVSAEPRLLGEAVVQIGGRAIGRMVGGGRTGDGKSENDGQQRVMAPKNRFSHAARERVKDGREEEPPGAGNATGRRVPGHPSDQAARDARYSPRIQSLTRLTSPESPSAERR